MIELAEGKLLEVHYSCGGLIAFNYAENRHSIARA
jgi:hypothetical protein